MDRLKLAICCTSFDWMPAPLWALVASPLLHWAGLRSPHGVFVWPLGRSKNPLRGSFWNGDL